MKLLISSIGTLYTCTCMYSHVYVPLQKTRDEYAEDVAACRGHNALRGMLSVYRMVSLSVCNEHMLHIAVSVNVNVNACYVNTCTCI